ncbi:hypothetical protein [Algisphaera agarilytica]|uniref:Uncharacterized protein n=1 Tax=Algisphaera agarilytica TaxID=1385975 RepID=A0A7X0H4Q1_9BACT|nr:hypothetical protein [Algisphaera agarilytica]MBB6429199.1 hypothetical protein [Algisphaera agarilytica]
MPELTYHPIDEVETTEAPQRRNHLPEATPFGVYCNGLEDGNGRGCGRKFAPGAVFDGAPTFDRKAKCWVVVRRFYCPHCETVTSWFEQCDETGELTGVRLTAPLRYSDPKAVETFLNAYPEAAGVMC